MWYTFRFRFRWDGSSVPKWWLDLFIVDTVVRDLVDRHKASIRFWRFHRRAQNDAGGHTLSFFVYTDEHVSKSMNEAASAHQSIILLRENDLLADYRKENSGTEIEAASDPCWSKELRDAWPSYVMGISNMILELVSVIKSQREEPDGNAGIDGLATYYESVSARLAAIWQNEGSHALLHHLNAMFGYVPVLLSL